MRILHTSDWHLGRQFHGLPLDEDHDVILDQIAEAIEQKKPDVLIIAGDIFDRVSPPQSALTRFGDFIKRVTLDNDLAVVAIAGNHDSAAQIGMLGVLPTGGRALVRGPVDAEERPLIIEDKHGPVAISALPFCYEFAARACFEDEAIACPADVLRAQVESARRHLPDGARWVIVAHAFVEGAAASEGERPLSRTVGGIETVPSSAFDGAHYVALGHLHRPQKVGAAHIRYSGAPLAFDDEEEVWHDDPEQHDVAEIVYLVLYWTVALKPEELRGLSARLRAARSRLEKALFDWSTLGCPLELFDIRPIGTRLNYGGNRIEVMARFWTLDNELRRAVAELEVNDFPELTGHRFGIEADKVGDRQKTKSFLESRGAHGTIDQLAVNMIALHHDVGEVLRSGNLNAYPASEDSIYLCEDGHVSCIGSSASSPPVSWYDNVVHVKGITLPEATLAAVPGSPITRVVDHKVLSSNMIVTRAHVDADWPEPILVIEFEQPRLLYCRYTGRVWEEPS